jgi:ATP-dependent RNA helicase DeaD
MNVGRANNADPRWLLPLICRIGHVTKKDVGAIRIGDNETRFAISVAMAPKFAGAVRRSGDEEVRIEPAPAEGGLAGTGAKTKSGKPYRAERPYQQVKRHEAAAAGGEKRERAPDGERPAYAGRHERPAKRSFEARPEGQTSAAGMGAKPPKKKRPKPLPE